MLKRKYQTHQCRTQCTDFSRLVADALKYGIAPEYDPSDRKLWPDKEADPLAYLYRVFDIKRLKLRHPDDIAELERQAAMYAISSAPAGDHK